MNNPLDTSTTPKGSVDLTNCDREPIHILGRVQSFGALIAVSSDWLVSHASENIAEFIGAEAQALIGRPLTDCLRESAVQDFRARLQMLGTADAVERLFGIQLTKEPQLFDVAIHLSGRSIVLEIERHSQTTGIAQISTVRPMIDRIGRTNSIQELCDIAAKQLRGLVGFDRVMVYKFNEDDTGTVVAEAMKPGVDAFKGLRYPASDIPKQARLLYKRNLLRIISDVSDEGQAVVPATNPEGKPLDLSLSATRAVSPIHLEYLRNMGVGASMSISILKRGELWGLFACHHETPKILPYETRTAAELFGQLFSFLVDQKEADDEREKAARARLLHDQLVAQIAEGSSIADSFETVISTIESVIPYDGVVGWIDGKFEAQGQTPTEEEFRGLVRFLNTTAAGRVFSHEHLQAVYPGAESFSERAAGLLALPVSRTPRDYIVLFRHEIARSVKWAGNPEKPVQPGPHGARLTPRKSFEAWQQVVRGHCEPWSDNEVNAAEALRITLLEVVLRMTDASNRERAKSQERQEILIAELNHRVRNILNLIRSLIQQSQGEAHDMAEFTDIVGGRIHALARAHDQITKENWSPASVRDLVRTETEAYLAGQSDRIRIEGDDPLLKPGAFSTLSLVIHELVTNAAKYGALCDSKGSVLVRMTSDKDGALNIAWRERGGPPIQTPPERRGFGSTIIERSIPYELKGAADVRFVTTGLEVDIMIPPSHVAGFNVVTETGTKTEEAADPGPSFSGNVLLVEDNMIIAMDGEEFLADLGAEKVHIAATVADALDILEQETIDFALLDVNLGDETSEPVGHALHEKGIRFAFATGYGDTTSLTKTFPGVAVVTKPYDPAQLQAAVYAASGRAS